MKHTQGKGFIRYQTRTDKDNPSLYGIFCPSCHGSKKAITDGNKDLWLDKVIDKASGIFFNKKMVILDLLLNLEFNLYQNQRMIYSLN
jgi:hypothetical protein